MKKIKYLFLIILIPVVSSCTKEILDKKPLDIISDEDVWNNVNLTEAYLAECYATTYVFENVNVDNSWTNLWHGDAAGAPLFINNVSDESKSVWHGEPNEGYWYKLGLLKIDGGLLEWWDHAYSVIRKLNVLIQKMPSTSFEDDIKKQYLAEARWLRAYNYFEMVKRYGGVPLITVPQTPDMPEEDLFPKRNKEQEVYDFIISECDTIANDLPEVSDDVGRPTRYAALALKCRAALYAGSIAQYGTVQLDGVVGINSSEANNYYQKSYDAAKEIIASGNYALYNAYPDDKVKNFKNLFLEKNNPEVIFAKKHDENNGMGNGGNGWGYDFWQCPPPNGWGGGNHDGPYLEMAEEFEHVDGTPGTLDRNAIQQGLWSVDELWANKDPRFYATIYTQDTPWQGDKVDFHLGIRKPDGTIVDQGSFFGVLAQGHSAFRRSITGFGVMKYLDESHGNLIGSNGDWATSSTDWQVFRYGEVLLNYAEAAFELGKPSDALDAVNQIRDRAGIAPLSSIDRDKIRHERKIELAFEGHRYWDLRRWRTAVTVLSKNRSALCYVLDFTTRKYKLMVIDNTDGVVTPPAFYERNYYLPVTLRRTGMNPNLVENPGY